MMSKSFGLSLFIFLFYFLATNTARAFYFVDTKDQIFSNTDYKGQWILVNVWSPTSPGSLQQVKELNELNKRKDVVVIGIAVDYFNDYRAIKTMKSWKMNFARQVLGGNSRDAESPIHQLGNPVGTPASYLFDPKGRLVTKQSGTLKSKSVVEFISFFKNRQIKKSKLAEIN